MKTGFRIDRDYLWKEGDTTKSRVGVASVGWGYIENSTPIRFRCLDDDGVVYYGGSLVDDDECNGQEKALNFCMNDAGCTTIQVKYSNEWVQEIG